MIFAWMAGDERLIYGEKNGRTVVTDCKRETAFTKLVLYEWKLPVLTLQDDRIIDEEKAGEITHGFYASKDGNKFYSYLLIGGVKYDLGRVGMAEPFAALRTAIWKRRFAIRPWYIVQR